MHNHVLDCSVALSAMVSHPCCLLAFRAGTVVAQPTRKDSRVGKKIIVAKAGAELRTPKAIVWKAYPGKVFEITLVNGEWLWIQEKEGWMWETDGLMFDDAINEVPRRLVINRTAETYHVRGVVFLAHQKYKRALDDFSASLIRSPRNACVLNNRGQCHYLLKNHPAAIADFTETINIDPKHTIALNNRVLAHIAMEQYAAARRDVQKALKINPKYPEPLLNCGVIYEETGDPRKSIADYTAALKIYKKYAEAYGNRAKYYRTLERYKEAIEDLRRAIQIALTSYAPVNDLAFVLATARKDELRSGPEALALAEQAIEMSENPEWTPMTSQESAHAEVLDTLAAARAEVNDFDGDSQAIEQALKIAPEKKSERVTQHKQLIAAKDKIRE